MKTINNNDLLTIWQKSRAKNDIWRNNFHIEMPFGLVNDPNGLCFFNNEYHIFYQWNPFNCEHKFKHWGYIRTRDFLNYSIPQLALAPIDSFDKDGCYSGSAYVKNDNLYLIYTGNVKNRRNARSSCQILVKKNSDGTFSKEKIIIPHQPPNYTAHFRDPYIFKKRNKNYIILGAQRSNLTGCTLIYREQLTGEWTFTGELQTNYDNFGYMWECPNLITLNGNDILLFCPQGLKSSGHQYNNLYQSGYIAGKLNNNVSTLSHGKFTELDNGFDFYAPQVLSEEKRSILFGWVGMPEQEKDYPSSENGWLFSLTLPRQLHYKNNRLYQYPVVELQKLRKKKITYQGKTNNFSGILPAACEIHFEILPTDTDTFSLTLGFGNEAIIISYKKDTQEICIDRSNMLLGGKGKRYLPVHKTSGLVIDLFIDKSIMELYAQKGYSAATWTYYPQHESTPILQIFMEKKVDLNLTIYELGSIKYS
ncbi:sucrose-6-phosphate hydrolase [Pectinatus sottacetonis]|uniref:sucrose-6-phosphate hydrolase n=1 Tax=Pectinatus sottacetonis TaxID=1002795 RepID=UPI0018C58038|nr:sucrose-6-phosphate hydrolase [Pectinatus sottacetonis]